MRRSTSMTSGRGQRMAATSARHSRGFCANYGPSPLPSPWKGERALFPRPRRGRGQGEGASNVEGALNLIYELLNLGNSSAAKISICRASSAASQIASRTKYEHPASMKRWSCSAHWAGVPMMPYFRARGPKSWA